MSKAKRKSASDAGQDLRMPVMGGTKFPTNDSKQFAKKQFQMSNAEVGPIQPSRKGAKIEDIIPKYGAAKKASEAMDPVLNDPLVQYLKKEAAAIDTNVEDMATGNAEPSVTKDCPHPTENAQEKGKDGEGFLKKIFSHDSSARSKFKDKDFEYSAGVVDRVLGLK